MQLGMVTSHQIQGIGSVGAVKKRKVRKYRLDLRCSAAIEAAVFDGIQAMYRNFRSAQTKSQKRRKVALQRLQTAVHPDFVDIAADL